MRFWSFLLWSLASAVAAEAVQTAVLTDEGYGEFFQGELSNVSLGSNGEMATAPALEEFVRLDEPAIWAVAVDPEGRFVVGTGNAGKVLRISREAEVTEVFNPDSILSRALAIDSRGDIYVGTSPNGAIYRLPSEGGKPVVHYDPEDVYIWDLAIHDGALWVTTGFPARLLRLPLDAADDAEAEEWFRARDDHLMTLHRHGGEWLVGSSSRGILYGVSAQGEARAIYKANEKEIRGIGSAEDGSILVSSYSDAEGARETRITPADELPPMIVTASADNSGGSGSSATRTRKQNSGQGQLIRIDREGVARSEWRSGEGGIFALTPITRALWLLGFSQDGKLYGFANRHDWELIHQMPRGGEISEILESPAENGVFYVFTSNPGAIYRLGGKGDTEGRFVSRVLDAGQVSRWGRLESTLSRDGELRVETRSGFTDEPDSTWTAWTALDEGIIASAPGRFFQYRLIFPAGSQARFLRARVFHELPNAAPLIADVRMLNFGVEIRSTAGSTPLFDFAAVFQQNASDRLAEVGRDRLKLERRPEGSLRTAVWRATDPNGDALVFDVMLRRADSSEWFVLARRLTDPVYVFNAAGMEPGHYQLKIVASDAESNAAERALTAETVSELVLVDAIPPVFRNVQSAERRVSFEADGGVSRLVAAQVIVDGDEPVRVRPVDGLFDSPVERFEYELPASAADAPSVLIEVLDESGNQAAHMLPVAD